MKTVIFLLRRTMIALHFFCLVILYKSKRNLVTSIYENHELFLICYYSSVKQHWKKNDQHHSFYKTISKKEKKKYWANQAKMLPLIVDFVTKYFFRHPSISNMRSYRRQQKRKFLSWIYLFFFYTENDILPLIELIIK